MQKRSFGLIGVFIFFCLCLAYVVLQEDQGKETRSKNTVVVACSAVGAEFELCKKNADAWAKKTGNHVKMFQTPNLTNDRLALFQQIFAARSSEIDVIQIDVVWPGLLGKHFIDLNKYIPEKVKAQHFPRMIENNTNGRGELVAMPFYTDAGLLFYRKDLLEKYNHAVPQTWQQLENTARDILKKSRIPGLVGYVWQGKAYEGLTCNAVEWLSSYGAPAIVDDKGNVTVNSPRARQAISMAEKWVGTISPQGVLNYDEEMSRGVFQSGQAVFMRNWPYAWSLANEKGSPIAGKVGVTLLPKGDVEGGQRVGALGGWNLSVSKYSTKPDLAADLVAYLTSKEVQLQRALEGSYNPTIPALYDNKQLQEKFPFAQELKQALIQAVARPSAQTKRYYSRVTNYFWNAVYAILSDRSDPEAELERLAGRLERLEKRWKE